MGTIRLPAPTAPAALMLLRAATTAVAATVAVLGASPLAPASAVPPPPPVRAAAPGAVDDTPPGPAAEAEPSSVAPGGTVRLRVTGCGSRTGTATSSAFGTVRLLPGDLRAGHLFGSATVHTYARQGGHRVNVRCGGPESRSTSVRITVSEEAAEAGAGAFHGMGATAAGALMAAAGAALLLRRRARTATRAATGADARRPAGR
ncbi:hypothetical protein [Streptomyces zingiberis]|uniref:Sortase n=1 Tax=Streptomyces zingiberis TaxID=2053010 RepID=A0ABX1BPE3_9ACTN|nr:hypothetical protein [Streptomyces zingiberis]NJP99600.1 hypothetical protein [Streptomyces zingiberis]